MEFILYLLFLTFTTFASDISDISDNLCTKKRRLEKMLVKAEEAENERQKAIKAESDRKPYNRYMDFIGIISK